ncbi:uncharacterized protein PGTG_03197 [Puccinia graminis f. sp. tritici CRL 75-36-700-3]|uniref:Uncharacterized protein n=1 Tax=Puccinia graminis f. sp. tritici (strain CRL 75-36-700-3 / race SCCL) TaxID=418459 RepID=E3JYW6_PUCGT|nr:uncharacterized protein PGTG_03197 [Puccinia graminis f. sp. tritici CRL 75-36-700-3]EFP77241.1 hypothetical protein PGTG_03197 [Puccinia graminis f. sp. tritici CRL 75-36-700-3]
MSLRGSLVNELEGTLLCAGNKIFIRPDHVSRSRTEYLNPRLAIGHAAIYRDKSDESVSSSRTTRPKMKLLTILALAFVPAGIFIVNCALDCDHCQRASLHPIIPPKFSTGVCGYVEDGVPCQEERTKRHYECTRRICRMEVKLNVRSWRDPETKQMIREGCGHHHRTTVIPPIPLREAQLHSFMPETPGM